MQDAAYELRRILLPRNPVNRDKKRARMRCPSPLY
jgi:hypothetical protein